MMECQPAFLVMHGSFNPVHRHHLEMMVHARQHLEAAGFRVLRGILAITDSSRLTQKGVEPISDEHRLAALQLGCNSMPGPPGWLVPEERGVNYGSGNQLVHGLRPELLTEAPGAAIFKVLGADTAVQYKSELREAAVVVCRLGSTVALRKAIKNSCGMRRRDLILVEELPGDECSSTKLREALRLEDAKAVRRMCPELVAEYLLTHRMTLYSTDSCAEGNPGNGNDENIGKAMLAASAETHAVPSAPALTNKKQPAMVLGLTGARDLENPPSQEDSQN